MQKIENTFVLPGRTIGLTIIAILLRFGWKISEAKEKYLKFEAYWDQYCSRKVTENSEMTVNFVILPALFEIDKYKEEEELQDFVRDVFS